MDLNLDWINITILFGALNALAFSVILLFQRRHPGFRYFALFTFVFAYNGFETFNWSAGINNPWLDLFSFIVIFLLGPSLLFYTRLLIKPDEHISRRELLIHFAVPIFHFVSRIALLAYHFLWINKVVTGIAPTAFVGILWMYAEPLSVALFMAYTFASIRLFRKSQADLSLKALSKDKVKIRWIRTLLILSACFSVAWTATILAPYFLTIPTDSQYYPIEIALVIFTYWLVLNGYHKVKMIASRSVDEKRTEVNSNLPGQLDRIVSAMESDRLYLDPELTLAGFSNAVGLPQKTISVLLNQHRQVTFIDFVNHYRLQEVKRRLIDPALQHLTISGIALQCGFNSQATFQRVFKNSTGMSPKQYLSSRKSVA